MIFKLLRFSFFCSVILGLNSCMGTSEVAVLSSSPFFSSLSFAKIDSIPNISKAVFTLEELNSMTRDSVITNVDSLPFKTRVDSVFPTFSFKSTSGIKLYFPAGYKYKKDSAFLTGKDTVDFSQELRVRNFAQDGIRYKDYKVKVNVHLVDPELYVWRDVNPEIDSRTVTNQKAIIFNDTIFYYSNSSTEAYLQKSIDGKSWNELLLTNFPKDVSISDMQLFNGKLYTKKGDVLYSSSNGRTWQSSQNTDLVFKSLLFAFNSKLWAVVQSKATSSYHFASSVNAVEWTLGAAIPANFPVYGGASISFLSRTGKSKVLVVGGISKEGNALKSSWSSEDGIYWVDFSRENKSLDTLATGASIISYDKKMFVFGLRTDNLAPHFKQSVDEGFSWQTPIVAENVLPTNFTSRSHQSVVVYKPRAYNKLDSKEQILESNRIFLIGGQASSTVFSDVWTGKLNRKNFLRQ